MTFFETNSFRQQVEILRRFTTEIMNDKDFERYDPYDHTEEIEDSIKTLFFSYCGITGMALWFGCPEFVIMEKVISMGLYAHYEEFAQQHQDKHRALCSQPCDDLFLPCNQHEKDIDALRRATCMYPSDHFVWTDDKRHLVFWLFKMGEDLTDIALLLGLPEQMIAQKFIEDGLYFSWDTPWFAYSDQETRDRFINDCMGAGLL